MSCPNCSRPNVTHLRFDDQFVCRDCGTVWQRRDNWQDIEAEIKSWAATGLPLAAITANPLTGDVWAVVGNCELNLTDLAKRLSDRRAA